MNVAVGILIGALAAAASLKEEMTLRLAMLQTSVPLAQMELLRCGEREQADLLEVGLYRVTDNILSNKEVYRAKIRAEHDRMGFREWRQGATPEGACDRDLATKRTLKAYDQITQLGEIGLQFVRELD